MISPLYRDRLIEIYWLFYNLKPSKINLGLSATLREQPLTLAFRPRYANNL
ncbi:hypothetical protein BJP36_43640 [Moorena producens JHB]|uniref:Uncharacterized protein n=1 Tax=Moorena producens (strain JHB) TaxID=1454205 RepID=A0A9Q9UVX2_MOOP1|nr:hypothetical protein [Moorena producens]WAN69256.1 hypothetical protein BJP36_43640 [Moorena producens JHB]